MIISVQVLRQHTIWMWASVCLMGLLSGLFTDAARAQSAPVDVRLVVDVSSEAKQRDPQQLRGAGIEYVVSQLSAASLAGLWYYSRHVEQMVPYGEVDAIWRQIATIHARNLGTGSRYAELGNALKAATWDWQTARATPVHIMLFSDGRIMSDAGEDMLSVRQALLNDWGAQLRSKRIVLHAVTIAPKTPPNPSDAEPTEAGATLLRQLTQLSGGLYKTVGTAEAMQQALSDVLKLATQPARAVVDPLGRFQIAPGTRQMSLLWNGIADQSPQVTQPNGAVMTRLTSIENGRWLLGNGFEMVTLHNPAPGWWRAVGHSPLEVVVADELQLLVDGIVSPVLPTNESSATIHLAGAGEVIENPRFHDLVHVEAWVRRPGDAAEDRLPLPIDRDGAGYRAYFVNLEDGLNYLDVAVTGPTFERETSVPFEVYNPMRVEFRQDPAGVLSAWVTFNHPEVDYAGLRIAATVRKPPARAKIHPAQVMPGGLHEITVEGLDGIIEVNFSVSGNYLNKKGFFLKTKTVNLTLPLASEAEVFRFDAQGQLLEAPQIAVVEGMSLESMSDLSATNGDDGTAMPGSDAVSVTAPEAPVGVIFPWWFVALISLVNLAIGGAVWWLLKPTPLGFEPHLLEPEPT